MNNNEQTLPEHERVRKIDISMSGLSRRYSSYRKPEGILASLRGFLKRDYQSVVALSPTSLTIEKGCVVGLVGANGAGKTTLLKLLAGLIAPSEGHCSVLGYTPWERNYDYLHRISILLGQKNQLWWDLPPLDSFRMLAAIYGLSKPIARERVRHLADRFRCSAVLEVQLRRLSLGERMKMELIGALLHQPEILFLDEPTIGLDVVAQDSIREFLSEYVKTYQPTIILTSHYMDDISYLASRLLLMSRGKIVYDGSVHDFTEQSLSIQRLIVTLEKPIEHPISLTGCGEFSQGERILYFQTSPKKMPSLIQELLSQTNVQEIKTEEVDFEEVIKEFLGKT